MSIELGPLPEPTAKGSTGYGRLWSTLYTADQMRAYALQERAAEREQCARTCNELAAAIVNDTWLSEFVAGLADAIRAGRNYGPPNAAYSLSAIDRSASR